MMNQQIEQAPPATERPVPDWYHDLFPAGAATGFVTQGRGARAIFVKRSAGPLLITLEETANMPAQSGNAHPALDRTARYCGWSHLACHLSEPASAFLAGLYGRLEADLADPRPEAAIICAVGAASGFVPLLTKWFPESRVVLVDAPGVPAGLGGEVWELGIGQAKSQAQGPRQLNLDPAGAGQDSLAQLDALAGQSGLQALLEGQLDQSMLTPPPSPVALAAKPRHWPAVPGNVWMLQRDPDGALSYLSDRWAGRVIGYEERDQITLAQTPPDTVGMASFGDWVGLVRPLGERFPWHVVDHRLDGYGPDQAARSHGVMLAMMEEAAGQALPGVSALDLPCPASRPADLAPDSKHMQAFTTMLAEAVAARRVRGQTLLIDRLCLGILAGAPDLSEEAATDLYRQVTNLLSEKICGATGQVQRPFVVITQGAGSRIDGGAASILAEARLEMLFPASAIIVAGPSYRCDLMAEMPATPTPKARLLLDELEAHAVATVQSGKRWVCPTLCYASQDGTEIIAEFTTLAPLVLDKGPHGFQLDGCINDAEITEVRVISPDRVRILCSKPPQAAALAYAWGFTADGKANRPANHGALRDGWTAPSIMVAGTTLTRPALAGRVPLRPLQTQSWPSGRRV